MQLTCAGAAFRRAVEMAYRAVSSRAALPALGTVLLQAEPGRLTFTATDLEITIRTEIAAEVDEEVAAAVPARLLAELCPHLQAERVRLTFNPERRTLSLSCGALDTSLRHFDADEFPPGPVPDGGPSLVIPAQELVEIISDVLGAASTDEARPVMTGVLVRAARGRLTLTASNGYCLAERWAALPTSDAAALDAIVPARALAELVRALRAASAEVQLSVAQAGHQAFFTAEGLRLSSSLIEGTYPNYGTVIPTRASTTVTMAASDLASGLRAVSVVARDAAGMVVVAAGREGLRLESSASQVGESFTVLPALLEGTPLRIAFNGRYLVDALATVTGDVELSFDGPLSPAVVRRPGRTDFLHLVMPLRHAA
jgi:DNA polymerase-3 subunit beta